MKMATENEEEVMLPMDENTRELLELFPALNKGELIEVEPYGKLKEIVVMAAIGNGVRNHEIIFIGNEEKGKMKPGIRAALVDGVIVITADKALLDQIETDVMSHISPEILAQTENPLAFISKSLREMKRGSTPIKHSADVIAAFAETYRLYRRLYTHITQVCNFCEGIT